MPTTTTLPDGLALRTAREDDVPQLAALLAERGEPADADDLRLVVDDPDAGLDAVAVVVDGDRVVSTATLLDETLRVRHPAGAVELPAGQVELVATDRTYEGRGLVRALMSWAHERSAARGHDLQVMIGIPYFYRRFGYEYAIDIAPARAIGDIPAAVPATAVRPAVPDDVPVLVRLQAVVERHGSTWRAVLDPADGPAEQYYVRLPDPPVVLDRFRPVFAARLAAAGVDRAGQEIIVSTFGRHHRMAVDDDGALGEVRAGGAMQAPGASGGCGVAPDALAALLVGPLGMHGLCRRRADVYPGPDAELFETLFPPLTADLLTWYLPY